MCISVQPRFGLQREVGRDVTQVWGGLWEMWKFFLGTIRWQWCLCKKTPAHRKPSYLCLSWRQAIKAASYRLLIQTDKTDRQTKRKNSCSKCNDNKQRQQVTFSWRLSYHKYSAVSLSPNSPPAHLLTVVRGQVSLVLERHYPACFPTVSIRCI